MSPRVTVPVVRGFNVEECFNERGVYEGLVELCELMCECYPDLIRIEVDRWEDSAYPSDHELCLSVAAILPVGYSQTRAREQERELDQRVLGMAAAAVLGHFIWAFGFDGDFRYWMY